MVSQISLLTTLIIAFVSIYIGLILAHLSKIEVQPALKYIKIIRNILFSAALGVFAYFIHPYVALIALAAMALLSLVNVSSIILFPLTAFIFFYANMQSALSFEIIATLTYLLGLTIGIIFYGENDKLKLRKMLAKFTVRFVWFLVIGGILILI